VIIKLESNEGMASDFITRNDWISSAVLPWLRAISSDTQPSWNRIS